MNLERILQIANECVESKTIETKGLTLLYRIDNDTHEKLDKELFLNENNNLKDFVHNEIIELNIADIIFIFEIE